MLAESISVWPCWSPGIGIDEVDEAVDGVGAVAHGAGAADDFDRFGGLVVDFEQRVDVAEAGCARRHAVLEDEERALPCAGRQHRRADGDQQLLSGVHLDVDAGNGVEDFGRVVGVDGLDVFGADDGIGARILDDAVAVDEDDVRISTEAPSAREGGPQ